MAALLGPLVGGVVKKVGETHQKEQMADLINYKRDMDIYGAALKQYESANDWEHAGEVGRAMDERTNEMPGWKKQVKQAGLPDNPLQQAIGKIGGVVKQQQQQRQQQTQQQAISRAYGALPNAPASVIPGAAAGASGTPGAASVASAASPVTPPAAAAPLPGPPNPSDRMNALLRGVGPAVEQARTAQAEKDFEATRKRQGVMATDTTSQQKDKARELTEYFKSQGMDDKSARDEADRAVFGKQATVPQPKLNRVANATSDQYPELNIKGKTGTVFIDPATNKAVDFVETQGRMSSADDVAKWAKVLQSRNPNLTPELAVQQAANELFKNKFMLPEQRLQLQRDAVRTIVGETGTLTVPTHQRNVYSGAGGNPPKPPLPAMPSPKPLPGANGTKPMQTPQATGDSRFHSFPEGFSPKIPPGERTAMDTAQGVMVSATRLAKELPQMAVAHPNRFGTFAGRITSARMPNSGIPLMQGTAPAEFGDVNTDLHSVAAFLTGVHRARGIGYANKWAEVLGNPFVNPEFTIEALKRATQVATAVQKEAAKGSRSAMTMEQVTQELARTNPEIFKSLDTPPGGSAGAGGGPPASAVNPYR